MTKNELSILLVDDDKILLETLYLILQSFGFLNITKATTGRECLKLYTPVFDMVFLDIEMPEKCGIQTLKELRLQYPDVYVVIVSGHMNMDYFSLMLSLGAKGYVYKPFTPKKIEEQIKNYRLYTQEQAMKKHKKQ